MDSDRSWLCRKAPKLKYLALKGIYYKLLNTSYIFTHNRWTNCSCDQFQGCQLKPLWSTLNGERKYCFVCWVGITYNADKIQKLTKIADVFNNYREIKKDSQLCVDFDPECDEFWLYHYKITKRGKFNKNYWWYLSNFAEESYHWICHIDKWKIIFLKKIVFFFNSKARPNF